MADYEGVEKTEKRFPEENIADKNEYSHKTNVKRPTCDRCKRPKKVCLCEAIPDQPLEISTTVYILQHPEERHRTLTTVPLLCACLPNDKCIVYNDVRYSQQKYPALHKLLKSPQTLVLYPDANATDLREVVKESKSFVKYNLVVPDGTWRQARKIFKQNDALQQARKEIKDDAKDWLQFWRLALRDHVQLNENSKSHYVIRTQPTRNSLSTLEAIAVALSILEERDEITEVLRKPLQLLCDIQLQHGAVPHSSKEEKREQELRLQEQQIENEIANMEARSQQSELQRLENEVKMPKHNETTGSEGLEQEKHELEKEVRNSEGVDQFQQEYLQQHKELSEKHSQTEGERHVVKHVPKRPKLDE